MSWRAGFFLNVPVGIVMVFAARRFITETGHRGGRFDLTGALCATLGMTALVFAIVNSASNGWGRRSPSAPCWPASRSWPAWSSTRPAPSSRSCRCGCSPAGSAPAPTWSGCSTSAR
ncbi:MAG: hypothetical protein ACRDPY_47540 [Streptosporangiaceae bacterium]